MMHLPSCLIISILVLGVLAAGCTGPSAPPSPQVPANTSLSSLALVPGDLPPGFTLVESREKTSEDVGSLARDLGWNGGYGTRYVLAGPEPGNVTTVLQSIALYPEENVPAIAAEAESQDRAAFNQTAGNLTLPDLGTGSRGFSANVTTIPGAGLNNTSLQVTEIILTKGKIFEVLRMSGPGADAASLIPIAEKAYAKIP